MQFPLSDASDQQNELSEGPLHEFKLLSNPSSPLGMSELN